MVHYSAALCSNTKMKTRDDELEKKGTMTNNKIKNRQEKKYSELFFDWWIVKVADSC